MEDLDTSTLFETPSFTDGTLEPDETRNCIVITCTTTKHLFDLCMEALKPLLSSGDVKHFKVNMCKFRYENADKPHLPLHYLTCIMILHNPMSKTKLFDLVHVVIPDQYGAKNRRVMFTHDTCKYYTAMVKEDEEEGYIKSIDLNTVFNLGDYIVASKTKSASKCIESIKSTKPT